jgi:hypothetical protein
MFNPWFTLSLKTVQMGMEAQSVIALRMLRMAAGGARAEAEVGRMVSEKVVAAGEAQVAVAAATLRGHKKHAVAGKVLNTYRKRVTANRRRLSRR